MEAYRRLPRGAPELPELPEGTHTAGAAALPAGLVRVTASGSLRSYVAYALGALRERGAPRVTLRAAGRAVSKAVTVAEVIKRREQGLHQVRAQRDGAQRAYR